MNRIFGVLAATACMLGAGTASALPIELTDEEVVNEWLTTWESTSWEHNFAFNPLAESIISATLTISFWDDERDSGRRGQSEFAIGGILGSWDLALGEVDTGTNSFNVNIGQVADGVLGVWVTSLFGDFGIGTSKLSVVYNPVGGEPPVTVPEPATLALLGAALLGFGLVRRQLRAK